MRQIEDLLVVRVRVDRRHEPRLDPERVVQHLRHRPDAVRGAGGVRHDVVAVPVVGVVIHAEDERHVRVGRRGRDDDLLRARFQMELGLLTLREQAGGLEDDLHTQVLPRQARRIPLVQETELISPRTDDAVADRHVAGHRAEHRVVLQEVCHRRSVAQVVHGYEVDVGLLADGRAEEVAADSPEAVDANAHAHSHVLLSSVSAAGFYPRLHHAPPGATPRLHPLSAYRRNSHGAVRFRVDRVPAG